MDEQPEAYLVVGGAPVFNALFYGEMGSGKTTLAASAQDHPKLKNVLFANIEGGLLSIEHRGDVHAVDIASTAELEALFWSIARGEKYESVNTIVIDSGTELQTKNLEEIVAEAIKNGGQSRSGKKRTRDDVWQDDYGKSTTQLKRIYRWFKDLDKNLIVTALSKQTYPKVPEGVSLENIEPLSVLPSMTAKLGESLMGYMDFVWYTYYDPDTDKYFLLTKSQGPFKAKTRGPRFAAVLGQTVENPNMAEIYDLLLKSSKKEERSAASPFPSKKKKAAK